jgi:hypothetical protein
LVSWSQRDAKTSGVRGSFFSYSIWTVPTMLTWFFSSMFITIHARQLSKSGFVRIEVNPFFGFNLQTDSTGLINWIKIKAICPHANCCGNTKLAKTNNNLMWICERNHRHKGDFDHTEL